MMIANIFDQNSIFTHKSDKYQSVWSKQMNQSDIHDMFALPRAPQFVNIYWLTIKCISRPGAAGAWGNNNPRHGACGWCPRGVMGPKGYLTGFAYSQISYEARVKISKMVSLENFEKT